MTRTYGFRKPGFPARFPGTCVLCEQPYPAETRIVRRGSDYAHATCHEKDHE